MKIKSLKGLTADQERIYQGLSLIGELMGAFYLDGLMIIRKECMLQTKVNLIAHCAREIDGGFRDVFAPEKLKLEKESTLPGKDNGHYASILVALGFSNEAITNEWVAVAGQFHKLAHRHGAWLKPKEESVITALWERYEKILKILTGSVYAFRDRMAHLLTIETPTKEILGALTNLFADRQNEFQFYRSLDKTGWLRPLYDHGYLDITTATAEIDEQGRRFIQDWFPLRYLANIASQAGRHEELLIKRNVLEPIKKEVTAGRTLIDDYCLYQFSLTISRLPGYVFDQTDVDFFLTCSGYMTNVQYPLHESVLLESLTEKYVETRQREGLINLLVYCFGFRHETEKLDGLEEMNIYSQEKVMPNIKASGHHRVDASLEEIIKITGKELLEKLIDVLENLNKYRSYELGSIPSVEYSGQTEMYTYDWILNLADLVRAGAELLPWAEQEILIHQLLASPAEICIRIAIHLIRLELPRSLPIILAWVEAFQLYGHFPIHELYLLLQEMTPTLSDAQLKQVLAWLENIRYDENVYGREDTTLFKTHQIRRYLSAFKLQGEENLKIFATVSQKYDALDKWPLEHPEFDNYSTVTRGFDTPVSMNELENLSVGEQVALLEGYQPTQVMDTSPQGLAILLSNCIITTPDKYKAALDDLLKLKGFYLAQVVNAFTWVLKNGHLDSWMEFTGKLEKILFVPEFEQQGNSSDQSLVLTNVAEFLLQLADNAEKLKLTAAGIDYLMALTVKLLSLERYRTTESLSSREYMHHQLNSMAGKAFEALIHLNASWLEINDSQNGFHPALKTYLEQNLGRTTQIDQEYSIGLGYHFSYLLAANPDWCNEHAAGIFPVANQLHLNYTLGALLSPYKDVFKNVIRYLKVHGINRYAVQLYRQESPELNRLSRFGLTELFYINLDALDQDDAMVTLLLEDAEPAQLLSLIKVAQQLKYGAEQPLLSLWEKMQNKCLANPEKYRLVLEQIPALGLLVPLNESALNLLRADLEYLTDSPVAYQVSNKIFRSIEMPANEAAELTLSIWKKTKIRVRVSEELSQFVERVYQEDFKDLADEIAHFVAAQGDFGLKIIYDRNQIIELGGEAEGGNQ